MDPFAGEPADAAATASLRDDQLRLLFTCCHPALALDARVALSLRTSVRPVHGRDRPGAARARGDDGQAPRAGEAQDRRRPHPLPGAGRPRAARPARRPCSPSSTCVFTEGHTAIERRRPRPRRPLRRGDPAGPAAPRAAARRARGRRPARAAAPHRCPAGDARRRARRPRAARRPGPLPVGPAAIAEGRRW